MTCEENGEAAVAGTGAPPVRKAGGSRRNRRWLPGRAATAAIALATLAGTGLGASFALTSPASAASRTASTTASRPVRHSVGHVVHNVVVEVARRGKLGLVLVDGSGQTLYYLTHDPHNKSTCYGKVCPKVWPPLVLPRGATHAIAAKGVTGLGVITRAPGIRQVTFRGKPLYRFSGDTRPGMTKGEGLFPSGPFKHAWWVVHPSGSMAFPAAPKAKPTTPTTKKSSGYGSYGSTSGSVHSPTTTTKSSSSSGWG